MKTYKVEITLEAEAQLTKYLEYLLFDIKNEQAYEAVKADYLETLEKLTKIAGSIKLCDNPALASRQIRKIQFKRHSYVILYRIKDGTAEVVNIFHTLQDYENNIM